MKPEPRSSPTPLTGRGIQRDEVELGYVSGVFGLQGEVRLFLHNRETDLLDRPREVVLVHPDGRRLAVYLTARTGAGKRILGRIAGVDDPEAAGAYKDWRLVLSRDELPALDPDEFYLWQLEGLAVYVDGEAVGRVVQVHSTGPVDIFEIEVDGETTFVPALKELVLAVDVEGGRLELAPEALAP